MADDSIEPLARWLTEQQAAINIARDITVRMTERGAGERTIVSIERQLSCPLRSLPGWRITTRRLFLPSRHFSSYARHCLRTADHERGRTIYCGDHALGDEVVAAIRYHIDERPSWPVFVLAIGFRTDFAGDAELRRRTVAGAFVAKQYVHALAETIGRGGTIDSDVPTGKEEDARALGFRRAPRLRGLRVAGTLMCQPPLA